MGGVVVGSDGEIIFSDVGNNTIRKISRNGDVRTVAGGGVHWKNCTVIIIL